MVNHWNREDGNEQRVCEDCGEVDTRVIPALGHDYGEWTVIKLPSLVHVACFIVSHSPKTCAIVSISLISKTSWHLEHSLDSTPFGVESRECSRCHEILETREIDTITHIFGEWKIEKEATCVEDGNVTFEDVTACKQLMWTTVSVSLLEDKTVALVSAILHEVIVIVFSSKLAFFGTSVKCKYYTIVFKW